jgi:hypothetical protein
VKKNLATLIRIRGSDGALRLLGQLVLAVDVDGQRSDDLVSGADVIKPVARYDGPFWSNV